jgi:outer membrane protein OmpA-like peptidoglycan-associated protein
MVAAERAGAPRASFEAALRVRHDVRRSVGKPLDGALRTRMEARLGRVDPTGPGYGFRSLEAAADRAAGGGAARGSERAPIDFSNVRLHADGHAASAARRLGASAFTIGNDIYADEARLPAGREERDGLVAHELAHVAQQRQLGTTLIQPRLIATGSDADIKRFFALAQPAMGEKLTRDPATNAVATAGTLPGKPGSPAFAAAMHKIIDDPATSAEAHFGADLPDVSIGAYPFPADLTKDKAQRIDMDDIEAMQKGVPGSGVSLLAHELTENYQAHGWPVEPGVSRLEQAHYFGIQAESDVAEETIGPGRRVASASTGTPSAGGISITDFEKYYIVFTRTKNAKTGGVTVSKARKAARETLLTKSLERFAEGSQTMPASAAADVAAVAAKAAAEPTATIRIEGFGDDSSVAFLQLILSQFRADDIKSRLIAAGVVSERIHAIGLSQSRLVVPNTTPDNKARNRRVEITVDRPKP